MREPKIQERIEKLLKEYDPEGQIPTETVVLGLVKEESQIITASKPEEEEKKRELEDEEAKSSSISEGGYKECPMCYDHIDPH
jgi:hypothetical protein